MSLFTASPPVREALAGSMIWEEHRGNLAHARTAAEEQVRQAQQNEPRHLAESRLTLGLVRLLQGEPAAALDDLAQADRLIVEDDPLRALILAYTSLALRGCFHVFPDGSGGVTLEIQDRWDLVKALGAEDRRWAELAPKLDLGHPEALFEAGFVFHLLRMLPLYRQLLEGRYVTPPERVARQREMILGNLLQFHREAEEKGAPPGILAWLERTVADIHRRLGEEAEAQEWLDRAFDRSAQAADPVGMAVCRMTLGDWRAAPLSSPSAWNLFLQEGTADSSLAPLRERTELGGGGVDTAAAEKMYTEAETLFRRADAQRGLGALELRRGYLRQLQRDFAAALDCAERAEKILVRAGDLYGLQLARAHRILARIGLPELHEEEETAAGIGRWGSQEGSFAFASGLGLLFGRAGRHWLLRDGDFERALATFRQARRLFEALGAPGDAARTLADEGETYLVAGEHDASLVAYEGARDRFLAQISARPRLATSAWQRALQIADQVLHLQLRRRDADGLERSAARFQELRDREPPPDRSDLHGPGFQDIPQRRIADRLANIPVLAPLCRARDAFDEGRPDEAQRHLEAALEALRSGELDGRDLLEAQVLAVARRFEEAAACFLRYLDRHETGQSGRSWMFQDELIARVSRIGPAGEAVAEDHPLFMEEIATEFFVRVKDYARAKVHLDNLESAAGPDWWRRRQRPWESLAYAGSLHEGLGQPALALELYDTAIRLLDEQWGLLRRDDLKVAVADAVGGASIYLRAARASLQAGVPGPAQAARAFGYAERGKARALLDLLAASASVEPASDPKGRTVRQLHARLSLHRGLLARERELQQPEISRIAQLERQIQDSEADLRRIEAEWMGRSGAFPQASPLDLEQVRERLPGGTALLFYFFHQDDLIIWAIPADAETQVHRSEFDTRVLSRKIRDYQKACYDSKHWEYEPLGKDLSQVLLTPVTEILDAYENLILVPHGAAHLLPFAVLPWRGDPLADSHVLSHLPSASSLRFLRSESAASPPTSVLAVGNPARMSYQPVTGGALRELAPLPGAAAEAAFVASLYPESEVLLEGKASRETVRERISGRQVLHFATHGILSEQAPLLSSIQLADGGSLSVHDLLGERLDARLVVLSACETAHGRRTGGDDVLGLTRGLLAAGANAALVSLWKVGDTSTSLLMSHFHGRLRGGEPPALALQRAQAWLRTLRRRDVPTELEHLQSHLTLKEDSVGRSLQALRAGGDSESPISSWRGSQPAFRLPYFWAPFILIGRG